jgi:uncharacterized protein YdhG (YjbR/CyaY superfamily)
LQNPQPDPMIQKGTFSTVEEYINLHPAPIRKGLALIRKTIKTAAPGAEELISYQMPAYKLNGMLAFFSATKNHYGFYPTSRPIIAFRDKLKSYETSKGAIRFPLDKPIPVKLITEIVKWQLKENLLKAESVKRKA